MGQLYSRVIKRFTQCSQSRSLTQQQADQTTSSPQRATRPETIPVGQSIDSTEYAALVANAPSATTEAQQAAAAAAAESQQRQQAQAGKQSADEEAAIKIQATWRGHVARKALRGGQSLSAPAPSLSASGSQAEQQQPPPPSPRLESIAEDAETTAGEQEGGREHRKLSPLTTCSDAEAPTRVGGGQLASPAANSRGSLSPALSEAAASIDLNCDTPASASIDIVDHHAKLPAEMMATVLHTRSEQQVQQQTVVARPEARGSVDLTAEQHAEPEPEPRPEEQHQQESATTNGHAQRVTVTTSLPDGRAASDSLESEEVAAIRIQSAFRGYRTRKNSPYRNRSPGQHQQVGAELASNGTGEPDAEMATVSAADTLAAAVAGEQADLSDEAATRRKATLQSQEAINQLEVDEEQADLAGRLAAERRQSRSRHREGSGDVDEPPAGLAVSGAIRGATSLEEFTTTETESTVKQVAAQPAQVAGLAGTQQDTVDEAASLAVSELSDQLASLGAALEPEPSVAPTSGWEPKQQDAPRASLGGRSEISLELDTDSSNLGAILSMRDEDLSAGAALETDKSEVTTNAASLPTESELEAVARRLVEGDDEFGGGALAEAGAEVETPIGEEERRELELNSDDIERRDPRGQVSEERAKSPQIRTEPPTFAGQQSGESSGSGGASPEAGALLTPPPAEDQQSTSGRSSGCGSSAEDEEGDAAEGAERAGGRATGGQQQQAAAASSGGRNRKRNNRNKRKGNKK